MICEVTPQDYMIKGSINFMDATFWFVYHHPVNLDGHRHCNIESISLNVCSQDQVIKELWFYRGKLLIIYHHLNKFDSHGHCDSEYFQFFRCLHLIIYLNGYMNWWVNALTLSHHTATSGDFKYCSSGDITFLICLVTSLDHLTKGS